MDKPDTQPLMAANLNLPLYARGKVRDIYDLGNQLLIVATDRISAFDVVLPSGIPGKGIVLNQLSVFWFRHTKEIMPNHLLEDVEDASCLDTYLAPDARRRYPSFLVGRSMIVKKVKRLPIECVVRGYLAGSAWDEYRATGSVCGVALPKGLRESAELAKPIFTPSTKAESGHDMPMTIAEVRKMVGKDVADQLEAKSIEIYTYARDYARQRDIIIADTKMEFGTVGRKLILIDELLTPDSSRFWPARTYEPGRSQPSFDKQPVRDWLVQSGWNKQPPAPELPPKIIAETAARYAQAYESLTGMKMVL